MTEEIEMQKEKIMELEECEGCQALNEDLEDKQKEIDDLKN